MEKHEHLHNLSQPFENLRVPVPLHHRPEAEWAPK